jgi:hypothetical protein
LHGPKNDQSLCNIVLVVSSLKIRFMNMFCPIPKVLHNKSVNTIPSLCIYKLSQNSNYEIRDFFMMKVLHKIMPLGFNGTSINI